MESYTQFKCTSCLLDFKSVTLLKEHHKSDWHRYNLKRHLSEKPPVSFDGFKRKLELLSDSNVKTAKGRSHLKNNKTSKIQVVPSVLSTDTILQSPNIDEPVPIEHIIEDKEYVIEASFFDNKIFPSIETNIAYMEKTFSLFIPDREYLKDLNGLIKYLGDKLYLGHQCLYCNRPFKSLYAVRAHMISKGHTSIGTSTDEQLEELESFYDYSDSYKELHVPTKPKAVSSIPSIMDDTDPNSNSDGWVTDDEDEDSNLNAFIARHGIAPARINEYGNLILPNGGEAAHRSIAYIYRQRLPMQHKNSSVRLALAHAKQVRALTQNGMTKHHKQICMENTQKANFGRQRQRFDLRIGTKNNKLQRTMLTAEKYFI